MWEDKIIRLENLMEGVLPTEEFMEELISLRKEHELLKEKFENHPEILETNIKLKRVRDELERLRSFFDMGERDVVVEEIHDLRSQLQYYTDNSPKAARERKKGLSGLRWKSHCISLAEELKKELETSRSHAEQLEQELDAEKLCSGELKEALQLTMEGQASMLEQHADLEEKHMQMLTRHRQMQEGIEDVKKAAARAGVRGAESKFINALAAEISVLKVEREKERRYFRDEKKTLQSQLRDCRSCAGFRRIIERLKEAEESVTAAETRTAVAEEETEKLKETARN